MANKPKGDVSDRDRERYRRVQDLFFQVVDLPPADRRGVLEQHCSDSTLVNDVLTMAEDDDRGDFDLGGGVAEVAGQLIDLPASGLPADVGKYRLTALLGEGGMGTVFRAERSDVDSVVAIKVLRDARLSPSRRARFTQEQKLLALLNHRSIAQLHDAGTLPDGTPFFVMEYVEGVAITEYCRRQACSLLDRLRLFRDVCEAAQYAHRQLVIHRDLKPSNILVRSDGQVKLLDFGISKRIDDTFGPKNVTRPGLHMMTPEYAAPEQLQAGDVAVDTDVYSLGVVLYELLTGAPPFQLSHRTPAEALSIVLAQDPEPPSAVFARALAASPAGTKTALTLSKSAWADLDVLTLTAMHKDRERRYRTVEALIRDIDHYLKGQPLEARPDSLRYRAAKFVGRNRRAVAGTTLAAVGLATLVTFYTFRLKGARDVALAEVQRTQRIERFMLSLFDGGDKEAGPKEGLRAVTLVDRGLREAQSLDKEPVVQTDLYSALGTIYQKLGNLSQADALLRSTLERRRSLFGPDTSQVANSEIDLGLLRNEQADFDAAEQLVRSGLQKLKRLPAPNLSEVAEATAALGRVLEDRGAYDKAIPVLEEAVKLHTAHTPESTELASSITELANCHFYLGHYKICKALNERALALDRKLHGNTHPLVSSDLINLGAIQFELGHYAEAERLYREGIEITRAWYGGDHHQVAADITMLARALNMQGQSAEALALLRDALKIQERVYSDAHPKVASVFNEIGNIAHGAKDYERAASAFRRMVDIYRRTYGTGQHYLEGIALANLGSVYLSRNELAQAETLFREAIAVYGKTLPADHLNVGIARVKLGRAVLRQGRPQQANVESLGGYEILKKQINPAVSWMQKAREDLVLEYTALGLPDEARKYTPALAVQK